MADEFLTPAERELLAKAAHGKAHGPRDEWRAFNRAANPAVVIDLLTRLGEARAALEAYHDIFPELWTSESEEIWRTDAPERFCDDRGNDIEDDWINVGAMAKAALAPPAPAEVADEK